MEDALKLAHAEESVTSQRQRRTEKKDICQYNIIRDYVDSLTKSPYVRRREGQNLMHLITLVRNWERIHGIGL